MKTNLLAIIKPIFLITIWILFAGYPAFTYAQLSQGGEPITFRSPVAESPEQVVMSAVDVQALRMEDELERESPTPIPPRFGFAHEVDLDIHTVGTWTKLEDDGRIWRLKIHSAGAYSINLIYSDFYLPSESTLFIYNGDKSEVIGAFTELNNKEYRMFSTSPVAGDVSILEYYEPSDVKEQVRLRISHVVHAYRNLFNRNIRHHQPGHVGYGASDYCHINVNCSQGNPYQNQKRAVAMILLQNGSRICSGSLVNNVRKNGTPYFLTARHCADSNYDGNVSQAEINATGTWIFMFNYQSPGCSNSNGPTHQTVSGATPRANHATSDFALLQLSSQPHPTYNTYYLGWSAQNVTASSTVGIHHPNGDIKKISLSNSSPTSSANRWYVSWNQGITAVGSSGSPLFDQNKRVIGQLWGGSSFCTAPNDPDWYGQFHVSWTGGGTNATRLRNWLDPDNTGTLLLNGMNALLAVFMDGLWVFNPGSNGQWTASAYGGDSPYSYTWHRSYSSATGPWTQVGTGTSYSQTVTQQMWLRLTASDSGTQTAQTFKWIQTCANPPCPNPKVVHLDDFETPRSNRNEKPSAFQLYSNYPNPFNPTTTIRFDLAEDVHVRLTIYDIMGREVARLADGIMQAGAHQTIWNANSNPSGMYIMRLEAGAFTSNRTMILLK